MLQLTLLVLQSIELLGRPACRVFWERTMYDTKKCLKEEMNKVLFSQKAQTEITDN